MRHWRHWQRAAGGLTLAVFTTAAPAQPAPHAPVAATQPTTRPASGPSLIRRDTALNAVITHAIAIARGDPATVRDSYLAETPDERALVDAFAHMAEVMPKLRAAAEKRYGKDGFTAIGFGTMFDDEIRRLNAAQKKEERDADGEVTTILPPGQGTTWITVVRNKKTGGEWKISVGKTFTLNLRRRADRLEAQTRAYDELAREIDAGKYPLALDARAAGREKVAAAHRAMSDSPTTASSTTPARK